jgi:hypothetical protein
VNLPRLLNSPLRHTGAAFVFLRVIVSPHSGKTNGPIARRAADDYGSAMDFKFPPI